MARKGENIYKRKDGRWEGRVKNPNGKYYSIYAKSYREVREKIYLAKSNLQVSLPPLSCESKIKAADLFESWLSGGLLTRIKPSTYESYNQCVQKYVLPHFRQQENQYLTTLSVSKFVTNIWGATIISETTRKKVLSIFKVAMREITKDTPESTLLDLIKFPQVKSCKDIPVFTINEQRSLESAAKNSKDTRSIGVLLCLYTGIRIGELCSLVWGDFDLEIGIMSISKTVSRIRSDNSKYGTTKLCIGTPKSYTSMRKIPLPEFLIAMLREYKSKIIITKENYNILSGCLEPFEPRTYQRIFKKILKEAGVDDRKFHALRHSFATRALELGVDIKTLSEILGHAHVNTTLNIYAHSLLEQKKIAIEKFNQMYRSNINPALFAVNSLVKIPPQSL